MRLPPARGVLSAWLNETLRRSPSSIPATVPAPPVPDGRPRAWEDEDFQLALWCCYELHYRGFEDVDEDWEWHPAVLAWRGLLERQWLTALRGLAGGQPAVAAPALPAALGEQRPVRRVPRAPLGLPVEGGGPAQLRHPAA
jgi:hypothetical protein